MNGMTSSVVGAPSLYRSNNVIIIRPPMKQPMSVMQQPQQHLTSDVGSDSDDTGVPTNGIASDQRYSTSAAMYMQSLPLVKKRGRPPKPDNEKKQRSPNNGQPRSSSKGELPRISLSPKKARLAMNVGNAAESSQQGMMNSFFPLVATTDSVKKRGRPRIHPPKDTSTKRPRGRPRLIEGEKGWRSQCYKLKRILKLKDALIDHMQRRLIALGQSIDDGSLLDVSDVSEDEDDDSPMNESSGAVGGMGVVVGCEGDVEEERMYEEVVEEQEVVEEEDSAGCLVTGAPPLRLPPSSGHQSYLNLFTHCGDDADDADSDNEPIRSSSLQHKNYNNDDNDDDEYDDV